MIYKNITPVQDASNIEKPTFQYPTTSPFLLEALRTVSEPRLLSEALVLDGREEVPAAEVEPETEGETADVAVAVADTDEPASNQYYQLLS